jgi:hypothetical protein
MVRQWHLSVEGATDPSTQHFATVHRLLACSYRGDRSTHDQHRVRRSTGISPSHDRLARFSCTIATLCTSNAEYQLINPTTQAALFSTCIGSSNCALPMNIDWRIYQGSINTTANTAQWQIFSNMSLYENEWFFGKNILFYHHAPNAHTLVRMVHRNAHEQLHC